MDKHSKKIKSAAFYVAKILLVLFVIALVEILLMFAIDRKRVWASSIPHNFSGDLWFSALVTIIAAVPGTFCGILALLQTQRLHELEDQYHKPILLMREAELALELCNSNIFSMSKYSSKEWDYWSTVKQQMYRDSDHEGVLSLKLLFELKSAAMINNMEITSIVFRFPEKDANSYHIDVTDIPSDIREKARERFAFHSRYVNGGICCDVISDLYTGQKLMSADFWKAVSNFLDQANCQTPEYRLMETDIILDLQQEDAVNAHDNLLLKVRWEAADLSTRVGTYMRQVSAEAVCSYIK